MARSDAERNDNSRQNRDSSFVGRCLDVIDAHPRLGWYIAAIATLNLVLNFIDAFNLFH